MKIYTGSKWSSYVQTEQDTGWRVITSELNLSGITGSTIVCYIRRTGNKCHLVLDIKNTSTSNHRAILLLAGSSNNALRKIGLPVGTALSNPMPALEDGTNDFTVQTPWICVTGTGAGVPEARQAEMSYILSTRALTGPLSYNVYEVEWITFDPWPTSLPGTAL